MNKRTVALSTEQYKEIIHTIKTGFTGCRPNERVALALTLEANLGIRISDVVNLRLCDIVQDGERYRLSITEQKTGKARTFTVPLALYQFIRIYCIDHNIAPGSVIVPLTTTGIQKHLRKVCDYLGYWKCLDFHTSNIQRARMKRLAQPIVRLGNPIGRPPEGRSLRNALSVNGTQKQNAFSGASARFRVPSAFFLPILFWQDRKEWAAGGTPRHSGAEKIWPAERR